jgi:hypothetical protein
MGDRFSSFPEQPRLVSPENSMGRVRTTISLDLLRADGWFRRRRVGLFATACSLWLFSFSAWAGSPPEPLPLPQPANPPFSIQQTESGWWLLSPEGKPFFSLGVCVVTEGTSRSAFDSENPGYAAWQHYPSSNAWADATLQRLKSWKFTTVGGWSDLATLRRSKEQTLCLTPVLHIGSTAGAPWWDMWDPAIVTRMDAVACEQILGVRDDPRLLGYYTDNEMGWWNATLWKLTLEQASTSGQRRRLLRLLRETYQDD